MADHEIVSLVSQSDEDEADADPQITHSEAAKVLETSLQYVEQHPNATAADIIFMKRWLSIASS